MTVKKKATAKKPTNQTTTANNNTQSNNSQQKVEISSVRVKNEDTVVVTLSQAQQLSVSAFKVMGKKYSTGRYNRTYELESLSTSDSRVYMLNLGGDSVFDKGMTVKVIISGLLGSSGEVSKETVYEGNEGEDYTSSKTYQYMVGDRISTYYSLDEKYGYGKVDNIEVPEGVSYKVERDEDGGYIKFSGSPTKAGLFDKKITYTDEMGHQHVDTIHWLIGSNDAIVGYMPESYVRYSKDIYYNVYSDIDVIGGSGNYNYEVTDDSAEGASIEDDDDDVYVKLQNATLGDKTVYVKISDKGDTTKYTVVKWTIHVKATSSVKATLYDALGQKITEDMDFRYIVKDNNKYLSDSCYYASYSSSDNLYSINLVEGLYDIYVTFGGKDVRLVSNVRVTGDSNTNYTVKDCYPVEIAGDNASSVTWYDESGSTVGYGSLFYLQKGTYNLHASKESGMNVEKLTASFTITNSKVSVTATSSSVSMLKGDISLNDSLPVTLEYESTSYYAYYKFVPTTTGSYSFYSTSSTDTYGKLMSADYQVLESDDDDGDGNNFLITYTCEAGKTYYIGIRAFSSRGAGNSAKLCVKLAE